MRYGVTCCVIAISLLLEAIVNHNINYCQSCQGMHLWRARPCTSHLREWTLRKTANIIGHTSFASATSERKCLDAGVEELDLESSIGDRCRLTDQLIQPLFRGKPIAAIVDIVAVRGPRRLAVDRYAEAHGAVLARWSHDEVKVARVEAVRNPTIWTVQYDCLLPHRPVARQRPLIEAEARRSSINTASI